jgi:response regulator RpfG family c-di-GMP phosphodiesterase
MLMPTFSELEFLLVSGDYATLTAVSGGVKKYGSKLALVPTADEARQYLSRRRIDAVFVDMEIPGSLGLIEAVRKGSSNARAAIFACVADSKESTGTLNAGANFLLRKPLNADGVSLHLTIAQDIMLRERRRYFRHTVTLPVALKDEKTEQQAKIVNLSEGGMAVRSGRPLKHNGVVEFAFELAFGEEIRGKGLVAWTSSEGLAGILVQTLQGLGRGYLDIWLRSRERLAADSGTAGESS